MATNDNVSFSLIIHDFMQLSNLAIVLSSSVNLKGKIWIDNDITRQSSLLADLEDDAPI